MSQDRRVSFDDEPLILVDEQDNVLGHLDKASCHMGDGILHRAFSIFLFDHQGRLLLQKRSAEKPLWGGYWSNTVCSHPRKGETIPEAAARRLEDELGIRAELRFLFRFQYQARFGNIGSENELCSVYVGRYDGSVCPNETEIAAVRWMDPDGLDGWIRTVPDELTPWFRMEWKQMWNEHWDTIKHLTTGGKAEE